MFQDTGLNKRPLCPGGAFNTVGKVPFTSAVKALLFPPGEDDDACLCIILVFVFEPDIIRDFCVWIEGKDDESLIPSIVNGLDDFNVIGFCI